MQKSVKSCALCQQPVLLKKFVLQDAAGQKAFCCQACLSVFKLLNPEQTLHHHSAEKLL